MPQKALVGIVGAGPLGLELAIALKENGISYLQFDKGQIGQTIYQFPVQTHFFSSSERISIAGIPIQTVNQQKCTREEYLAYLRSVAMHFQLHVHSYETVQKIEKMAQGFQLTTSLAKQTKTYQVRYLILAVGGTAFPKLLKIPGEDLPHVSVKMEEPHKYFQKNVMIVGQRNSAAETAVRCCVAGAKVTMIVRGAQFVTEQVKYWILPDLLGKIELKEIQCYYQSEIAAIHEDHILIKKANESSLLKIPADFVIKNIGFQADASLFEQLGAKVEGDQRMIVHDDSMQTSIPDLYVLGTAVAGTQNRYRIFIENTHIHVDKIMQSLFSKLSITGARKRVGETRQPIYTHPEE